MHEPQTWRDLLGQSIENPYERQRIANELGVNPLTLVRWVRQESNPRPQHLRHLLDVFPEQRQFLLSLIQQEFKDFSASPADISSNNEFSTIPIEFYTRVMHTRATLPKELHFWSLADLISRQAIQQLDPQRLGMAIIVAQCMPPSHEHRVRSLREVMGRGTAPWENDLEQGLVFLGAESLAGYAVTTARLVTNQNLRNPAGQASGYRGQWEESAAATPILFANGIAGCLLLSSTQPEYFVPTRCQLIEQYAELIALAFDPAEFYQTQEIVLGIVPHAEMQRAHIARFRHRVMETMTQGLREQQSISPVQAEQLVWQQLEEELLQLSSHLVEQ